MGNESFVGGDDANVAAGSYSAVLGGLENDACSDYDAIGGGYDNGASGSYNFIGGGGNNGSTGVWSDNNGTAAVQSTADYQFVARASGGFYFFTDATSKSGARLNPGSGAWSNLSDRSMKTGVVALDDAAVLAKVAALPVSEWSYITEHGVRHVGPMAQDFYAAFRVGEDDRHITSIDQDGVALAAIKALHAENGELHRESDGLHSENRDLRERLGRDAARFVRDEARSAGDEARSARDTARLVELERRIDALAAR